MPEALELLKTRRSFKPVELAGPGPSPAEIETLLTIASRVPDHGKLTPWRFIVFEGDARLDAGAAIEAAFRAKYPDGDEEDLEMDVIQKPEQRRWFSDKTKYIKLMDEIDAKAGIVYDPTATGEKAQQMMLDQGVRPEENILSRDVIRAKYPDEEEGKE